MKGAAQEKSFHPVRVFLLAWGEMILGVPREGKGEERLDDRSSRLMAIVNESQEKKMKKKR